MTVPIACNLDPAQARSQLDEWRQVRNALDQVRRDSPCRLELGLIPNADLAALVALAQREKACCPFFSFRVEIGAGQLVLVVEVPDDGMAVLDELASLITGEAAQQV